MTTPPDPYPWLPLDALADHLKVRDVEANRDALERARTAAADVVERNRRDLAAAGEFLASPAVVEAGVLLAARLYSRTGSPVGVAAFGEFAQTIVRTDPDFAVLLGLGRFGKPGVA
jgi:hypothetical protein